LKILLESILGRIPTLVTRVEDAWEIVKSQITDWDENLKYEDIFMAVEECLEVNLYLLILMSVKTTSLELT
jgi:hypothetical protein